MRDRIASMGVRYIVTVGGETSNGENHFLGDQLGLVLGWRHSSSLSFQAWDIASAKSLGSAQATASGEKGYGMLLLVPVVEWAPTESATCVGITQRLEAIFGPAR
jgi:hypothetical protein